MLGAATSVMGVARDGTLRVLAADSGTRDEVLAREAHIVATWNLAVAPKDGPAIERISVRVRMGVGTELTSDAVASPTLGSTPELRYVEAARPLVSSVEDVGLQEILTDARARWLRRQDQRRTTDSEEEQRNGGTEHNGVA